MIFWDGSDVFGMCFSDFFCFFFREKKNAAISRLRMMMMGL